MVERLKNTPDQAKINSIGQSHKPVAR